MIRSMLWAAAAAMVMVSIGAMAQAPDLDSMDFVLKAIPAGPVARVNGKDIPRDDYAGLYRQQIAMIKRQAGGADLPDRVRLETGLACLRMLVERELLYQEAVRRNLEVDQEALDKQWDAEIENMKRAFPGKTGKEPTEQEILEAAGATKEEARAELRKAFLIEQARLAIAKEQEIKVTEEEINKFFAEHGSEFTRPDRIHLNQIYAEFKPTGKPEDENKKAEARKKIENAIDRIHAGESFAAVAKAVSESPDRERGGDLGPIPAEALPPFYVEAAKKLKPGELSGVIESQYGFHVIKLIEAAGGGEVTLEQAKPHIRQMLMAGKTESAVGQWCGEFMNKPDYVEVFLKIDHIMATHPELKDVAERVAGETGPANQN